MVFGWLSNTYRPCRGLQSRPGYRRDVGRRTPGPTVGEADNLSVCHCEEGRAKRGPTWQSHHKRRLPPHAPPVLPVGHRDGVSEAEGLWAGAFPRPLGVARNDVSEDGPVPQDRRCKAGPLTDGTRGSRAWLKRGTGRRLKPAPTRSGKPVQDRPVSPMATSRSRAWAQERNRTQAKACDYTFQKNQRRPGPSPNGLPQIPGLDRSPLQDAKRNPR
jgi:hypothetical protein